MSITKSDIKKFKKIINKANTFFLTIHTTPDADALGSMLSIYDWLKRLGKKVWAYSKDELSSNLSIIPHYRVVKHHIKNKRYDVAIFFECSTPERCGFDLSGISFSKTISFDHHKTAKKYADLNILDFKSPSTSEIIWNLFKKMNVKINKNIALSLYAGIVTDTGRFHYPQTKPTTHIIASKLLEHKINFTKINDNFFSKTTYQNLKLLSRALESMEIINKVAIMILKDKDFSQFNADMHHSENIINYPMMLDDVLVSVLIKEDKEKYNVTMRSKNKIDVGNIALSFGGGGHMNASGFKISKNKLSSIYELKEKLIKKIKKAL